MTDLMTRSDQAVQMSPTAVRWTRNDCAALEASGVLDYRFELVEGVINRMGQNLGHAALVKRLLAWLFATFGADYVLTQMTIDVGPEDNPTSEPEPDVIVLTRPDAEMRGNPRPGDLRLVVEASDTTLAYDLTVKARLYARAGIAEYWVVSLPEQKLYIHRRPEGDKYREVTSINESERAAPLAAPDKQVMVGDLLLPPDQ